MSTLMKPGKHEVKYLRSYVEGGKLIQEFEYVDVDDDNKVKILKTVTQPSRMK